MATKQRHVTCARAKVCAAIYCICQQNRHVHLPYLTQPLDSDRRIAAPVEAATAKSKSLLQAIGILRGSYNPCIDVESLEEEGPALQFLWQHHQRFYQMPNHTGKYARDVGSHLWVTSLQASKGSLLSLNFQTPLYVGPSYASGVKNLS